MDPRPARRRPRLRLLALALALGGGCTGSTSASEASLAAGARAPGGDDATAGAITQAAGGAAASGAVQIAGSPGGGTFCAVLARGVAKCWGYNQAGMLGVGDAQARGSVPEQMGAALAAVDLGGGHRAAGVAVGASHACALRDDGGVRCWGEGSLGALGQGDTRSRGGLPGQMGDALPAIDLGGGATAQRVRAGTQASCALLGDGRVKCWGNNLSGQLGLGDGRLRGTTPASMGEALPAVELGSGRTAVELWAAALWACARLDDGSLKCWGDNSAGQLGLGDTLARGSFTAPLGDALPAVALGAGRAVSDLALGSRHACAVLGGAVKCWGDNGAGQLGLGDTLARGAQPGGMGDALPAVDLGAGRVAVAVAAGDAFSCAALDDGSVRCWGQNLHGQLGQGDTLARGGAAAQMGDALPAIDLGAGARARALAAAGAAACALLADGTVKCWGDNASAELGQGDALERGSAAGQMGDALPAVALD